MPDWRHWGFSSYEAWIESKAGASPREDWPQEKPPPHEADDEGLEEPRDA